MEWRGTALWLSDSGLAPSAAVHSTRFKCVAGQGPSGPPCSASHRDRSRGTDSEAPSPSVIIGVRPDRCRPGRAAGPRRDPNQESTNLCPKPWRLCAASRRAVVHPSHCSGRRGSHSSSRPRPVGPPGPRVLSEPAFLIPASEALPIPGPARNRPGARDATFDGPGPVTQRSTRSRSLWLVRSARRREPGPISESMTLPQPQLPNIGPSSSESPDSLPCGAGTHAADAAGGPDSDWNLSRPGYRDR